ncbi:hypothetical protein OEM_30190 [Mycobacterium intracellulare subsp. yongonense 05-1390]|nr:hypothetical protein OEM_30190 [Mycobacterium intracellulare subsp. yongonense 05-1390]ARR78684.1 hypothetical protein MOTT12_03020 [Mycobacterium intracellulare subsp. yongonense]
MDVDLEESHIRWSQNFWRHAVKPIHVHVFDADVIRWGEGILVAFQHWQHGTTLRGIAGDIY